jgi:oxidase EvaA
MAKPGLLTRKEAVASWLDRVRASDRFSVEPSSLDQSDTWSHTQGTIRHVSGRFFGIVGLTWSDGPVHRWQPFMEQREVGTLGFIVRRGEDGIELLVQAKTEPGNVGIVQLAPTCQATASNRDRVHGGAAPPYSGYFSGSMGEVISDSRQSEDGTRFFGKLNRNILVLDDHVEVEDDQHRWLPFNLFRRLLIEDFLVNTDARSVFCSTDWVRLAGRRPFQGDDDFSRELNASFSAPVRSDALERVAVALQGLRTRAPTVEVCALENMPGWRFDPDNSIVMTDGRLSVRHIRVHAETREVTDWDQPIFENNFEQAIDLECGRANGTLQFGFRPCWEPGLHAGAELAPTRLASLAANTFPGVVRLTVRQSNEGGRFFRDIANYRILDIGEARPKDGVMWLTLSEIHALLPRGFFNIEARSALSLLLSLA